MVQLSHPYMNTGKTIALTRWTFIGKVMPLLFNILSRFVIVFLEVLNFLSNGPATYQDKILTTVGFRYSIFAVLVFPFGV